MALKIHRNVTLIILYFLDQWCPPVLRDCKFFIYPIMKAAFGNHAKTIMEFKEKSVFMTDVELVQFYEKSPEGTRPTDLNSQCLDFILDNLKGTTCLDAGCGRGGLIKILQEKHPHCRFTGIDMVAEEHVQDFTYIQSNLFEMPFTNDQFETVICTHVLEHIIDYKTVLDELVRIASKRVIIAVPKQRKYKYTFDLHVHFLPYMPDFKNFIGIKDATYYELGGDFLCVIDK